jgi:hypothetical protein
MTLADHSARGSNAAFTYQFERALCWLAQCPAGASVGIETDDDVAVRGPNASRILEQDKHSIREGAKPFGDNSKDLWNTLSIWLDALENGEVPRDTTRFFMVTNKIPSDCIARQISNAITEPDADNCIAALRKAGKNAAESIEPLVKRVLLPKSNSTLKNLILHCELLDGTCGTAGQQLRKQTLDHLQLPTTLFPQADSIADELLGWLHKTVLALWQQGKPGWILRDHFVNQLHAILDNRRRRISRERSEHLLPVTDTSVGGEKGRPFVRQLHLVTDDETTVNNAIREFIRCNIERDRLSKEGSLVDDDWIAFEADLIARWGKIRLRLARIHKSSAEQDIGYEIFTETTEGHREKLGGIETDHVYLTAGTYHRLADLIRLGWHPQFEKLMQQPHD